MERRNFMKTSKFWTWVALLGGLLTVLDSAHELIERREDDENEEVSNDKEEA